MASGLALYADEATTQAPQKDPIYKVWKLPKRLVHRSSKPETRTVEAPATAESAKPANEWWGDQYWKTNRNAQQWPTSVAAAPKE
jgi:hypothetical protein